MLAGIGRLSVVRRAPDQRSRPCDVFRRTSTRLSSPTILPAKGQPTRLGCWITGDRRPVKNHEPTVVTGRSDPGPHPHHRASQDPRRHQNPQAEHEIDPRGAATSRASCTAQPPLIGMRLVRSSTSADFGRVTVRTPLRNEAATFSSATSQSRGIRRSNRP